MEESSFNVSATGGRVNGAGFELKPQVFNVRGKRVVLDREVAAYVGIDTKYLKKVVRRNHIFFEGDNLVFELTQEELLQCQNEFCGDKFVSLNKGRGSNIKYLPFAFTAEGVSMLEKVLKRSIPIEFGDEVAEVEVLPESWSEGTVVLYQPNDNIKIDVRVENETVWLTQEQMALLLGTTQPNIAMHIRNIFNDGELEMGATYKDFLYVQTEGGKQKSRYIKIYNLDMIISIGYRVNTRNGIAFRQWATKVIKQHLLHRGSIEHRVQLIENNIKAIEQQQQKNTNDISDMKEQVQFFVDTKLKQEYHFMDGEFIKASYSYMSIYRNASKSIIIIDNYIELKTLALLNGIKPSVEVTILSDNVGNYLTASDLQKFSQDYPNLHISFKRTNKTFHDRYIILDYKTNGEKMFHCGPSSKDAGEKVSSIVQVTDIDNFYMKIDSLLN